jgi:hypothetical protein
VEGETEILTTKKENTEKDEFQGSFPKTEVLGKPQITNKIFVLFVVNLK